MSQLEVNKVVRMLQGKPLKFTVRLMMKDGTEREVQSPTVPKLDFCVEARELFLMVKATTEYGSEYPLVRWSEVNLIQVEENPA